MFYFSYDRAVVFNANAVKKLVADNEDCIIRQALMNVHEDIEVCVDKVINRFAVRMK